MSQPLIISAGMPRAGSGWYYNLVHDLVVSGGGEDARNIRRKYFLKTFLTEVNCNISTLNIARLIPVLIPARLGKKFVIKTHAGPGNLTSWLLNKKWIMVIYIYRDPRAALLSAYEYGQRAAVNNRPNAFSDLRSLEQAAEFTKFYVGIWKAWSEISNVLILQYEDLLSNYGEKFEQTVDFLNLQLVAAEKQDIFNKYHPGEGNPGQVGTHFSRGEAERFRRELSPQQLENFSKMYESDLISMGYEV